MDVMKDRSSWPPAVVGAIVDLTGAAFANSGTRTGVDIEDIEHLVAMLHLLRPDNADFSFFDGWLHMLRDEWSEAEELFRHLVERSVCLPASRGMLLKCLKARDEFGWQDEARRIVEDEGDRDVTRLAKLLLAGDDLKHAAADARRTGRFVAPESARSLDDEAAAGDSAAAQPQLPSANDMLMTMHYMRI